MYIEEFHFSSISIQGLPTSTAGFIAVTERGSLGTKVWGARTTASEDSDRKYIPVRRLLTLIEQSVSQGIQWAVFKPNGPALWAAVSSSVQSFRASLWKLGGFQGTTQQEAHSVCCDLTTMTQNNIRLVCVADVALVRPAEFVIFQIGVWTQNPPKPPGQ